MHRKSQSALEYMMTYGWAILVIVIVAGVLYSLGIFSPSSSLSTTVTGFSNLGTVSANCVYNEGFIISMGNAIGYSINITTINITEASSAPIKVPINAIISPSSTKIFLIPTDCPAPGSRYSISATVSYTEPGQIFSGPFISSGTVTGPVSKSDSVQQIFYSEPLTIDPSQAQDSPSPFQQMINITSSAPGWSYISPSPFGQNVEFTYPNGTVIPSWLENYTSNHAIWWLKLASYGSQTIFMDFVPASTNLFNTINDGEAPQLSPSYAEYDDGPSVFNEYANFNGVDDGDVINGQYSLINNGVVFSSDTGVGGEGVSIPVFNTIYFNQTLIFYGDFFNGPTGITTDTGGLFLDFGAESPLNDYNTTVLTLIPYPSFNTTNYPTNGQRFIFSEGAFNNTNKTAYSQKNFGDTYEVNFPLGYSSYSLGHNMGPVSFYTQQSSLSNMSIKYAMVLNAPPNSIMPSVSFGTVS